MEGALRGARDGEMATMGRIECSAEEGDAAAIEGREVHGMMVKQFIVRSSQL